MKKILRITEKTLLDFYGVYHKFFICSALLLFSINAIAQVPVNLNDFDKRGSSKASVKNNILEITWPVGNNEKGKLLINLNEGSSLFQSIQLSDGERWEEIATDLDPVFILTEGERDLEKRGGWDIFFERTAYLPHKSNTVDLHLKEAKVKTDGARTIVF